MKPDWEGLEISRGELKHLSGLGMNRVYRPPTLKKLGYEGLKTLFALGLLFLSHGILSAIFPRSQLVSGTVHAIAAAGLILDDALKLIATRRHQTAIAIWQQVERYNAIVKAIDLFDRLEQAGNPDAALADRKQIIDALKLIREELVRALKTESLLRKNRRFLAESGDLFPPELSDWAAPPWGDFPEDTPRGRLLAEAWKVAVAVETQLKPLRDRRPPRF
ncbi:MAG: hypothetical protein ACP5D7_04235 [Limnospira sp.]